MRGKEDPRGKRVIIASKNHYCLQKFNEAIKSDIEILVNTEWGICKREDKSGQFSVITVIHVISISPCWLMSGEWDDWRGQEPQPSLLLTLPSSVSLSRSRSRSPAPALAPERSPQQAADQSPDKKSGINGEQFAEGSLKLRTFITIKSNSPLYQKKCIAKAIYMKCFRWRKSGQRNMMKNKYVFIDIISEH